MGHTVSIVAVFLFHALMSVSALAADIKERDIPFLTPAEHQWLVEHPVIRIAPDPDAAPIESFDDAGNYIGIAAGFVQAVEKRLGIKFEIVRLPSWGAVLDAARTRQADIYTATQTTDRSTYMTFTAPHIDLPGVIIVSASAEGLENLNALSGKKVAVVVGHVWQEWIARDHPGVVLVPVTDLQDGLRRVAFGQASAMITDLAAASHFIEKEHITNLRVAGETGYFARLSFGSRSDWPELTQILQKALDTIPPDQRRQIIAEWITLRVAEGINWQDIAWVVTPIGLVLLLILTVIALANRRLEREIVERRHAEGIARTAFSEAENANSIKDKFVSLVAHDLKGPLGAIRGFSDLLMDDPAHPLGDDQKTVVTHIRDQSDQLLTLIDSILDIGKLQTGKIKPEPTFCDAAFITDNILKRLAPQADEKSLTIVNTIPENSRVFVDETLFSQVIQNLVSNAIKFSHPGGSIELFKAPGFQDTMTTLAVRDCGVGINEEAQKNLFELAEKTSTRGTSGEIGTGFGLPLSHQIVTSHQGQLRVESQTGEGTTLFVDVPTVTPQILVVDDDPVVIDLLTSLIEQIGGQSLGVANGAQALDYLRANPWPHLVVCDLHMPVMDGFDFMQAVKVEWPEHLLPIMVLSSDDSREAREKSVRHGAQDFIAKPIQAYKFVPRLRRFIS